MSVNRSYSDVTKYTFVSMLFALVVADLATQASRWLDIVTEGWNSTSFFAGSVSNLLSNEGILITPLSHILLSLLLVSTSWVGWSNSTGSKKEIKSFLSLPFLMLFVEVFLVILYFSLSRTVDLENGLDTLESQSLISSVSSSVNPEARILFCVYFTYVIWDIISDVITSPRVKLEGVSEYWIPSFVQGVLTYSLASLLCMVACFLVIFRLSDVSDPLGVILGDIALACIILWFHQAKKLEYFMLKLFPRESTRSVTSHNTMLTAVDWFWLVTFPFLFVILICLAK